MKIKYKCSSENPPITSRRSQRQAISSSQFLLVRFLYSRTLLCHIIPLYLRVLSSFSRSLGFDPPPISAFASFLLTHPFYPSSRSLSPSRLWGNWYREDVLCEWYSRGSASRITNSNAMPSAALAHNVSMALLWPPLQWQTHTRRGGGKTPTKPPPSPISPSHGISFSSSILLQSSEHFFSTKHQATPLPLPTAHTTLPSPRFKPLYLTSFSPPPVLPTLPFIAFISRSPPRPLVTELAGDEREEFSVFQLLWVTVH